MKTGHNNRRISIAINKNGTLKDGNSQPNYKREFAYTITEIYEIVKSGGGIYRVPDFKDNIAYLRSHNKEDEQYGYRKLELPLFTPSADFKWKFGLNAEYDYSGIMCFDFDNIYDRDELQQLVRELKKWAYTKLLFLSPSGHGVKLFVMVPSDETQHDLVYRCLMLQLEERYGKGADEKCVNINRGCYFSYDEDAFFNQLDDSDSVVSQENIDQLIKNYGAKASNWRRESDEYVEFDFKKVTSPGVKQMFNAYLAQLEEKRIGWMDGKRDSLVRNVAKLKWHGMTFEECAAELLAYVNGRYTAQLTEKEVVSKLRRLWGQDLIAAPQSVFTSNIYQIDDYLTEQKESIKSELLSKGTIYINAPTGAGKTTLVKVLAAELGMKMDIIMPTTALVNQQSEIPTMTGSAKLTQELRDAEVIATTYNSIRKIEVRESQILVIDEAHSLVSDYAYKRDVIRDIQNYIARYDYIIYLSGSMIPLQGRYSDDNLLSFQKKNAFNYKYQIVDLRTLGNGVTDRDYFLSSMHPDALNVYYKNDKAELDYIYEYLSKQGYKVAYINSDNKDSTEYKGIVENQTLGNEYDVLLTTCLIQAGVNIKKLNKPVRITFGSRCTLIDYVQFVARFRENNPAIFIVHSNKLGKLRVVANDDLKARVRSEIALLQKAEERNQERGIDWDNYHHSVSKILNSNTLVFENLDGVYVQDDFLFLYHAYEVINSNITSNVRELKRYLSMHNFTEVQSAAVAIDANAKKEVDSIKRNTNEERKKRISIMVSAMLKGVHVFGKSRDKKIREVEERFKYLSGHLSLAHITPDMLTSLKKYREVESRLKYYLVDKAEQGNFTVEATAQLDYVKLRHLERVLMVNTTYSMIELKEKMERLQIDSTITGAVGVIFTYTTDSAKRNYKITGKHDIKPMLKDVSNCQMVALF
ncbi:BT4734/BF3469 family protein [Pontibacter chinhatensis]|uniref:ATPase family associated with various cellular activities (AAA) n=1 Tax=Pontibacter chinhatensis TaxID=1436961 RepID=A0A1I2ZML1_9BACT|nr:BT4734/BF3469 family protein [Pontibacter chinhatensis]SFH39092.1 ATPase family associated with various cellular activities (AAA) [Pontibacter chinhatensis]